MANAMPRRLKFFVRADICSFALMLTCDPSLRISLAAALCLSSRTIRPRTTLRRSLRYSSVFHFSHPGGIKSVHVNVGMSVDIAAV